MEVNIHHAKTNLSSLILKAEAGEEVIIARAGKPVVKLVPVNQPASEVYEPGALKGKIWFAGDDPFAGDDEIAALFENSQLFPDR
jgi:prevent-host-death family protein